VGTFIRIQPYTINRPFIKDVIHKHDMELQRLLEFGLVHMIRNFSCSKKAED
ncbi:hypothetical protein LINGRAHAP2_LOCUS3172, partial [Linum grandiflorum]